MKYFPFLSLIGLVRGAATYGGKLNRTLPKRCVVMMQRLLPAVLGVWIERGADEDWGEMCYPPLDKLPEPVGDRKGRPRPK